MAHLEVMVHRAAQVTKATRGTEETVALLGKRVTLAQRVLRAHKDQKEHRERQDHQGRWVLKAHRVRKETEDPAVNLDNQETLVLDSQEPRVTRVIREDQVQQVLRA